MIVEDTLELIVDAEVPTMAAEWEPRQPPPSASSSIITAAR